MVRRLANGWEAGTRSRRRLGQAGGQGRDQPRLHFALRVKARGPGFFRLVAATSVLGRQFVLLAGDDRIPRAFVYAALLAWVAIFVGMLRGWARTGAVAPR